MVKVPPIPLFLLIHSAEYHEYDPDSRYGEAWKAPVQLTKVRFEPNRTMQNQVPFDGAMSNVGLNMFYCCTNSKPLNLNFTEKSKIVWNGRELHINSFDKLYAFEDTPHHWELALE